MIREIRPLLALTDDFKEKYLVDFRTVQDIGYWIHYLFRFPNNYGVHVFKNDSWLSIGGENDLWEVHLLKFEDEFRYNKLDRNVGAMAQFGEVIPCQAGNYTDEDVMVYLEKVRQL